MHFCAHEFFAIVGALPFLAILAAKAKARWHKMFCCKHPEQNK